MLSSFNWYLRRCIFCPAYDFLGQILLSCCTFVSILEVFNTIPSGQLLPLCVTFLLLSFMCVLSWFNPFAVDGFQQGSCDLSRFASRLCIYIYHWNLKTKGGGDIFSLRVSNKKENLTCVARLQLGFLWWHYTSVSSSWIVVNASLLLSFWPSEEMMEMIVVWDAHVAEPQREISSM